MEKITFIITSSNRLDLLRKTIYSFLFYNTYPIEKYIIIDDSENKEFHSQIKKEFGAMFEIICNTVRIGQVHSIDKAYSMIKTPWIFHSEDDWLYFRSGFIEESLTLMLADQKIIQAWLRERGDTNGHPVMPTEYSLGRVSYFNMSENFIGYHGFSFNPGLKRMSDYNLIKPYHAVPYDPLSAPGKEARFYCPEMEISEFYYKLGYKAVILSRGATKHIGWNARVGWD